MDELTTLLKDHPNLNIKEGEDGKSQVQNFYNSGLMSGVMLMLFYINFLEILINFVS